MINSAVTFALSSLEVTIVYFITVSLNREVKLSKLKVAVLIMTVGLISTILDYFNIKSYYIISIIQYTIIFCLLNNKNWRQLVFDCPVAMFLLTSIQYFISLSIGFFGIDIKTDVKYVIVLLLIILILVIYTSFSNKIFIAMNKYYRPHKILVFFLALSMNLLLLIMAQIFYGFPHIFLSELRYILTLSIGYLIVNIITIYLLIKLKRQTEKTEIWADYAENVATENFSLLQEKHDFISHLETVVALADNDIASKSAAQEISDYITPLINKKSNSEYKMIMAENNFLTAYLSSVEKKTDRENIEFKYAIAKPLSEHDFTQNEMIVILSNLINNAIDEVLHLPGKDRIIELIFDYDRLIIQNPVSEQFDPSEIINFKTPGYSTKDGIRGAGLVIVQELLEKKGMTLSQKYKDGMFVSEILYF